MPKTGEERLLLFAQMANLVKVIGVPADVDVKSIAENFCRVSFYRTCSRSTFLHAQVPMRF